ncbi:MAG: type IX secretion system outer membrane channel protein PorV [Pelagibacterales bacterium]|nr:type IX secretion system outer membrane channel protein PorV [Pelagibacterales bacterium]
MKKLIGILSGLLMAFNSFAQIEYSELSLNTITTAVPFLLIAPDSRSGAMGDVGVATSPDANSMHWNPAKLAFTSEDIGASISYVPWLRALVPDINLSYITGYKKLDDNQAVGLEMRYFSLGDITFTDIVGTTIGQYKPHEFALGGSYARKLSDQFSLAISGRYIYSNLTGGQSAGGIETVAGQSIASDLAGFYTKPVRMGGQDMDLAVGLNISNIGSKVSYTETSIRDFIPINMRLGTALGADIDDYNKISLAIDMNKLLVPTPPIYDVNDVDNDLDKEEILYGKDDNVGVVSGIFQSFGDAPGGYKEEFREINYSVGSEYWYNDQFAIRAGYFFEHDTKGGRKFFTFGSGVKYSAFILDFSYLVNASTDAGATNPLANTMRFSMTWNFGAMKEMN